MKIFVCNLMTQANESLGLSAADHIRAIYDHAGRAIFDYALINRTPASPELKAKYALEAAAQIVVDESEIAALRRQVVPLARLVADAAAELAPAHQLPVGPDHRSSRFPGPRRG